MRLYLVGSHSVGKTTLARYISHAYHVPLLPELARTVSAEREISIADLRTNMEEIDSFQREVFVRQIQEEKAQGSFVSHRSFDNLAYAAAHSRVFKEIVNSDLAEEYLGSLRQPDVLIFFIRPSVDTLKDDGVREKPDWDGIVRIDAQVKLMLELFGLPYIQIATSSMQERVRLVDNVINLFKRANNKDTLRRGSCALAFNVEGKVLSVSRKNNPNDWGLPGGKKEPFESHSEAAIRELQEETGMLMENPCLVSSIDDGLGYYVETFVGDISGDIHTNETGRVAWVYPRVLTENSMFAEHNVKLFNSIGMPIQAMTTIPKTEPDAQAFAAMMVEWWEKFESELEDEGLR